MPAKVSTVDEWFEIRPIAPDTMLELSRVVRGRRAAWDTFRTLEKGLSSGNQEIAREHLESATAWGAREVNEYYGHFRGLLTMGTRWSIYVVQGPGEHPPVL